MKIALSRRGRLVAIIVLPVALVSALTLLVWGVRQKSLHAKLDANHAAQREGPRKLDAAAEKRIMVDFEDVPGITVEVGGVFGDAESLGLAADIHGMFRRAGYAMRPLAEYAPGPKIPTGVAVYSSHVLDQVLGDGVAQLFRELGQESNQWLETDLASPADAEAAAPPELKIIVGHRPP